MWKVFDAEMLEDGSISWLGIWKSLCTRRNLAVLLLGGAVTALVLSQF